MNNFMSIMSDELKMKMDKFFERHKLPNTTQDVIDNLNSPIPIKEI